ncbi:hypothetical protein [Enterobacter hormaechei]|uniref:hypothetical protein n=1 Tax=Enterobacter hormaechei TaxID=158836 RepID=UPI00207662AC|nr:hypothetical protein [Enterobacter hormaechei]MCM8330321.1 hypothetical protein [Enterobacter hormaechei]MCM8341841.1 hypothetical protein [Enterobacter hormaechei]MCM8346490.1 hypothetical protein [Enterobacter hormaechei]MDF3734169.1 hypothetical protein [Enterobacter hormaechei]
MSNIYKQAVQAVADLKAGYTLGHADVAILNELVRIALASLEAEAVALRDERSGSGGISKKPGFNDLPHGTPLFTAPPATVSLTEEQRAMLRDMDDEIVAELEEEERICRAAMLQGADNELQRKASIHDALCEKYNVDSLTDFVEWQRNHIAELEAAPPAPVGLGETAVMPDYPGYLMTQRECYQAGKKAGLAEAGKSPVIPDGWALVPVDPTEDMIVNGFESEPDESFSDEKEWEAYDAMSGCQQAAHRAKLCWAAMIAAAPKI